MSWKLQTAVAASLLLAGCGSNYQPAKASVFLIDRKCDIIETTKTSEGRTKSQRFYKDDCRSIEAWEEARAKRDKTISGNAVVKVNYTSPQDGSLQTAELKFTSRDDEFYDLKAGDEIDILVNKTDPTKVRIA